jgi:hypothetical protein
MEADDGVDVVGRHALLVLRPPLLGVVSGLLLDRRRKAREREMREISLEGTHEGGKEARAQYLLILAL